MSYEQIRSDQIYGIDVDFQPHRTMRSQFVGPHYLETHDMSPSSSNKKWQLPPRPSFHNKSKSKSKSQTNSSSWRIGRSSTDPIASTKESKSTKVWKKTKEFFNSLGEPPTAAYEREQAKKKQVKTSGREAFGAVNYGPYHQGGPFGGRT